MKITYIRWSMTIVEMNGLTIVTDPFFRLFGRLRVTPREYTIELLPKPDLILISHKHIDHWDPWTMHYLSKESKGIPLIVRPRHIADDAQRLGYSDVRELPPWKQTRVQGLAITAVPAIHRCTEEVGFVLQGEKIVYFAGDTSLDHGIFTAIGQRFDLDVVLLPIGGLRISGRGRQIDPVQAVEAIKLLRPRIVVGIHWGGLPRWLRSRMPGTPQDLDRLVARAQIDVQVRGKVPLRTVEV